MSGDDREVALQRRVAELEAVVAELRVSNKTSHDFIAMLQATVGDAREKIATLELKNSAQCQEIAALGERNAELEQSLKDMSDIQEEKRTLEELLDDVLATRVEEDEDVPPEAVAFTSPWARGKLSGRTQSPSAGQQGAAAAAVAPARSGPSGPTPAAGPVTGAGFPSAAATAALSSQQRAALSQKLVEASKKGRVDEMHQLIAQGAEVHYKHTYGETLLHWAAVNEHVEAVRLLLARGATVDATTNDYGETPLHWAALNGHAQCVEALAAAGADLNARDSDGNTPLHEAARFDSEGMVRALLALGADPIIRNNAGKTARDLARSDAVRALFPP